MSSEWDHKSHVSIHTRFTSASLCMFATTDTLHDGGVQERDFSGQVLAERRLLPLWAAFPHRCRSHLPQVSCELLGCVTSITLTPVICWLCYFGTPSSCELFGCVTIYTPNSCVVGCYFPKFLWVVGCVTSVHHVLVSYCLRYHYNSSSVLLVVGFYLYKNLSSCELIIGCVNFYNSSSCELLVVLPL